MVFVFNATVYGWEGVKNRDKSEDLPLYPDFVVCGEQDENYFEWNPSFKLSAAKSGFILLKIVRIFTQSCAKNR